MCRKAVRGETAHNAPVSSTSLIVVAAAFLFYAALSRRLDGTPLTAAMIFVVAGFVLGNEGLDWLHFGVDQEGVQLLAEATLAVVLFTDASRIDLHTLRREYGVPARLLAVGLPLTIVAGSIMGPLAAPQHHLGRSGGRCHRARTNRRGTRPGGRHSPALPSPIRQGLNVESGLNDGLCVPLLAIALAIAQADAGQFSDAHVATVVAEAIGWGLVGGIVAGVVAALTVRLSRSEAGSKSIGSRSFPSSRLPAPTASPIPWAAAASSRPSSAAPSTAGSSGEVATPPASPKNWAGC